MMRTRTVVSVLFVFAVVATLSTRPPHVSQAATRSAAKPRLRRRTVVALGAVLLGLLALASVIVWRFGPADEALAEQPTAATETAVQPTSTTERPAAAPTPSPVPAPQEWRLLAGGDVMMEQTEAAGIDPFAGIVPAFASAELTLVNVEMSVATGGAPEPKSFVFRAPPTAAGTMAAAGIDVGNLGNNHALDYGVGALYETMANLSAAGVSPVGAGENEGEAYAPAAFEVAGVRVAVIGATRVVPWVSWKAGEGPGLASAYAEARLAEAVRSAKREHDVVIVMVHWGFELAPCPNENQRRLGAALIDAGASVVLGTHPHVLQPIVQRGGGLIAYSLGNFVWQPRTGPAGETGVLAVRFRGAEVAGYELYPHVLDRRGAPVPAGLEEAVRIQGAVANPCA